MIKAIIFDFYGVIFSNLDWNVIDERIQKDADKAMKFKEYVRRANTGKLSSEAFMQKICILADDKNNPDSPAITPNPSMNYAVLGLIGRLNETYKFGLLSNGGHEHISRLFSGVGGTDMFFDSVITSSDTKHIKPSKKAFMDMTTSLGVKPGEALIIDDSPKHIAGARKAGLKTITFEDMAQTRDELEGMGIH